MPTRIEWCDETINPITGCTPISPGCDNCYAKKLSNRLKGRHGYPADYPFMPGTFHLSELEKPLKWKKKRRIFISSMGDLFHPSVKYSDFEEIMQVVAETTHTYIMLTKRPQIMLEHMKLYTNEEILLPDNLWLGVTAENQRTADERIPVLLQIPAAIRFVSVEPMLSGIDLFQAKAINGGPCGGGGEAGPVEYDIVSYLDWVICGAETGPGKRPMDLDWARRIRDQCRAAGVPFFFKKATGPTPDDLMIRENPGYQIFI